MWVKKVENDKQKFFLEKRKKEKAIKAAETRKKI